MARIVNFGAALVKHVESGMEKRSDEEIKEIFKICESCPLYKNGVCSHSSCGCNISNKNRFLNKIAWKDQHCPISKW